MDEPCHYWKWVLSISAQDKKPPSLIPLTICVFARVSSFFMSCSDVCLSCWSLCTDFQTPFGVNFSASRGHLLFRNPFVFDINILPPQSFTPALEKCHQLLCFHQGFKKEQLLPLQKEEWVRYEASFVICAGEKDLGCHHADAAGHADSRGLWRVGCLPAQPLHWIH